MARTPSHMIPLGTPAPDFELRDVISGNLFRLHQDPAPVGTVVMFICNHCPFVRYVQPEMVRITREYLAKGIRFLAISANDALQYPEDGPEHMREVAAELGYEFPYLYDETQQVALAFEAACTPDFFVYDRELKLVYRGQLDDARPGNDRPQDGKDMRAALNALLEDQPVSPLQKPSLGCNIKWKMEKTV
ncbi:thioredoxin family protein [Chitinophaga agrisoli]|nr:thioredoxin family protein [Chitinophaga agrisoli]